MSHENHVLQYLESLRVDADESDADFVLSAEDFSPRLASWVVYAWKRGPEFLYVGACRDLRLRLATHQVIGVREPVLPQDKLLVFVCPNKGIMVEAERKLIATVEPKYNMVGTSRKQREALDKLKSRCREYVAQNGG